MLVFGDNSTFTVLEDDSTFALETMFLHPKRGGLKQWCEGVGADHLFFYNHELRLNTEGLHQRRCCSHGKGRRRSCSVLSFLRAKAKLCC